MKFKEVIYPDDYTKRCIRKFIWFPLSLRFYNEFNRYQLRWLGWYHVQQIYSSPYGWVDQCWVDEDVKYP